MGKDQQRPARKGHAPFTRYTRSKGARLYVLSCDSSGWKTPP
jgi:hypothetical protein